MKSFCRALLLSCLLVQPGLALAQVDYHSTPLMVIRFNQPRVYFQRPLYNVISRALAVKASATFRLVQDVPSANPDQAERDLQAVLATLKEMGVPESRYSTQRQPTDARSSSIQVFVQ